MSSLNVSLLPFPVEALGPLKSIAVAVQEATLAPVAIPANSALAIASLAVQGFANVETLVGNSPLSLFVLTAAKSGERKSSCDAFFTKPVGAFEKSQIARFRSDLAYAESEIAIWDAMRRKLQKAAKTSDEQERKETWDSLKSLGPRPSRPQPFERLVSEPTFEGLVEHLRTGFPCVGLFSDEGGQFLGGYAMNKENRQKTMAGLNSFWDGRPIRTSRKGDGNTSLYDRRLSLHLLVQPPVMNGLLKDTMALEIGFLARCLIAEPASTIGHRKMAFVKRDEERLRLFASWVNEALQRVLPICRETGGVQPRLLRLTDRSRSLLVAYADRIESCQRAGCEFEGVTAFASKSAEQAARIAGVLSLVEDLDAMEIRSSHMKNGIRLAEYYIREAKRLVERDQKMEFHLLLEMLREWLISTWNETEISLSTVCQRAPSRHLRKRSEALRACEVLEDEGVLERLPAGALVENKQRRIAWRIRAKGT